MATKKKIVYTEPSDYFPKSIRKKAGFEDEPKKKTTKKTTKRKAK